MLHERHGKLPWKRLFEPAASIARNGFIVNYDLSNYLSGRKFLTDDPVWARSYAPDGNVVKEGDTVHRCDLAKTLDRIGAEGPDVFYQDSDIANNIVKAAQASGGILTLDDLREYKAILKNASTISYRGKQVVSTTAPSSGAIVLSILKIFEGFGGGAKDTDPAINLTTHFCE
jgi:gamma-glutamyltranspeptidase/glutathione hydrolase